MTAELELTMYKRFISRGATRSISSHAVHSVSSRNSSIFLQTEFFCVKKNDY
jgi:hypothetical protein